MITDIEQKQIDQIQYEEDLKKIIRIAKESSNPVFLQQYAINYNWDDGMALPYEIANNDHCDLGTALTLFWLAEGMSYFSGEVGKNEYNKEWAELCDMLIQRLANNFYTIGPVSFKPNINKLTALKYQKAGVPLALFQEVQGESI
ncbi:DUF4274 domain-containing protein [Methylophaga thalassica]|uniref:DUF4274 domain-containing protein n=1 Tax=Methylophaga aminisulfidivorans TaxID=230105 RepID=UPI0024E27327|nr:DUF4274 domain-containing protein [Methylophaga aminisulfidivorans]